MPPLRPLSMSLWHLQAREEMERQLAAAADAHRRELESARRDAASQLEASRRDSAAQLAGAEQRLLSEMAEMKSRCGFDSRNKKTHVFEALGHEGYKSCP